MGGLVGLWIIIIITLIFEGTEYPFETKLLQTGKFWDNINLHFTASFMAIIIFVSFRS